VTIDDGLTQGMKVVGHALHLTTVVADAEVFLVEDAESVVELQNTRQVIAEELGHEREPFLTCGLRRFSNDLMEFKGDSAEDPCHHDEVQSIPIDGWIGDVEEDVVVQGATTKREKHEVAPLLVVGVTRVPE
jgi:hypothetical protein